MAAQNRAMTKLIDLDLAGLDITWFACDSHGQLAAFYTGGHAPLATFLINHSEHLTTLRSYFEALPAIPANEVELNKIVWQHISALNKVLPDYSASARLAQAGLYIYDMSDHVTPSWDSYYFQLFKFSLPLRLADIDPKISALLGHVGVINLNFSTCDLINPSLVT